MKTPALRFRTFSVDGKRVENGGFRENDHVSLTLKGALEQLCRR